MNIRIYETAKELLKKGKAVLVKSAFGLALVAALTGCGKQDTPQETTAAVTETTVSDDANTTTEETTLSVEDQIAALQQQINDLQASGGYGVITKDDTYTKGEWDSFLAAFKTSLRGQINNAEEKDMESAAILLNIDYLDANSKQTLLDYYKLGQDEEVQLDNLYSVISQVREHNLDATEDSQYYSFSNLLMDEQDKVIITSLEGYAKEIINLKKDLTKENTKKIQDIFTIMDEFFHGKGTISVTMDGTQKNVAKADLSNGGKVAAETVGQVISVSCKDIVEQEKREELDKVLNTESLSELTKLQSKYIGMTYSESVIKNQELVANIAKNFNLGVDALSKEVENLGVTAEQTKALATVMNLDMLIDTKTGDESAFSITYADGIDIDKIFDDAEVAIRTIQEYNDTHDQSYPICRFVLDPSNVQDFAVVSGYADLLADMNSSDSKTVESAALAIKGFSQFANEVTINYQLTNEDGTVQEYSADKNALSTGAAWVIGVQTVESLENHPTAYGVYADAIRPLVDGSGFIDYAEEAILKVTGECAQRNIAVYNDYEIEHSASTK